MAVKRLGRTLLAAAIGFASLATVTGQTKSFIPVDGASLKARIDNAITQGRTGAPGTRFWVGYQFEARPGVAIDFEVVDRDGLVHRSSDGMFSSDARYETRELGLFLLCDTQRDLFARAEVYNLRRVHEFSGHSVYWTGRAANAESLNYLTSLIGSSSPEMNHLAERATLAIALHDDAAVESILAELIRRPRSEALRSRAIYWLGFTPESQSKNILLLQIVRNPQESREARQEAMSALGKSRAAATLPLLADLFETMTDRELRRRALSGISRNENRDGAATYLIHLARTEREIELRKSAILGLGLIAGEKSLGALTNTLYSDPETEIQKEAVMAIGRRPRDEAIPILIRTARSHPQMQVRKAAIRMLAQTGDERAVVFFTELVGK